MTCLHCAPKPRAGRWFCKAEVKLLVAPAAKCSPCFATSLRTDESNRGAYDSLDELVRGAAAETDSFDMR